MSDSDTVVIHKTDLQDKIKGGWAGQVIGCTYGGPTEFRWNGTMIDDRVPIPWDENQILWWYENAPGLYDDVYMDLTFVETFEKYGLDAPDSLHALAFAHAEYPLWHANQAARYNILNGIMPPASGNWKNNPHADDIDFQIEADFAGLMSPGMVNPAVEIANRIGHIMNDGDGVYGGIYVASMYALAFVYDDIELIVSEALKSVPAESEFHQCIADVIQWHKQYPGDWKNAWFETQKKWSFDKGCPDGVFSAFNIDAKINAAYIVIGLLYGQGDFGATIDISTRCGQDSDCNPANAAGILGTMIGYSRIPDFWKQGIGKVEEMNFKYTDMSLNKVYEIGCRHAVEMIKRNGGKEEGENLVIPYQVPKAVSYETSFPGLFPTERKRLNRLLNNKNPEISFEMQGCGFVITGGARKEQQLTDVKLEVDVYADGQFLETVKLPTQSLVRRHDVAWKYDLPEGKHIITLKARSIPEGYSVYAGDAVLYSTSDPGSKTYVAGRKGNL
ncbi:MAG: ADP-ribosylglycohydrolase family protein [Mangrovibacterium sp.]